MPPRSTPLLGFKPPFVKGGEVALPVLTGTGEWAELSGSPSLWAQVRAAFCESGRPAARSEIDVAAEPARPRGTARRLSPATPVLKPGGKIL